MGLESATYIIQLDSNNPDGADKGYTLDEHDRLIKSVLKSQFPNFTAIAMNASCIELNYMVGVTSLVQTQIDTKEASANKAVANGYASLDASILVPIAQIPVLTVAKLPAQYADTKLEVKDHGTKTLAYTIQLDEANLHIIEVGANLTLTIASTKANDKATIAIHNNSGYTITLAGIDNDSPTLTVGTNVQDFVGVVKSHGKITAVATNLNQPAI